MLKNESLLLKLDGERLREYHSRYFLTNVEKLYLFEYVIQNHCSNAINFVIVVNFYQKLTNFSKIRAT